ncbi:hypothetical protein [Phenylobacterium sp.]|uniref:hypothetical protein n=1 Tax=Phenylobacterium sp. TaxID=1871053 RepID=UPI0035B11473
MMIEAGEVGARQIVEAADGEAAADAPLPLGRVRWHCSEEDGGPDVGVELALGGGLTLYAGELADETVKSHGIKAASPSGWWLVLWGDKIEHIFGPVSDSYEAREAVDLMAGALRALEQLWRGASEEAVAYKAQADRLEDALNWFSGQHDLSLAYHAPVYCDDDEDGEEWRVYRERGPINDREWEMVGAGDDALKAILDARQTIAGEVAVHG